MSATESDEYDWLASLNPRRLQLLVNCARLGRPFTTKDLRGTYSEGLTSLTRDLNALENAQLLLANPSMSRARQGQRVTYSLAPDVPEKFAHLSALVADAWATPPPQS